MMIRLILFSFLLLTSLKSISQTATDSLICLPKKTVVSIVQDLEAWDRDTKQLAIYESIVTDQEQVIAFKDKMLLECERRDSLHLVMMQQHKDTYNFKSQVLEETKDMLKGAKTENFFLKVGIVVLVVISLLR